MKQLDQLVRYEIPSQLKDYLSRDQFRLYKLIWERFVASQMASAVMDTMTVDLKNGDIIFRANGSKIKFPGFMKVYVEGTDDQVEEKKNHCFRFRRRR